MSDEPTPPTNPPVDEPTLPFDDDVATDEQRSDTRVPLSQFLYIGKSLTPSEFTDYVATFDFASSGVKPSHIILHHTASPCTEYSRCLNPQAHEPCRTHNRNPWSWDAGDAGRPEAEIKERRRKKLENLREFYRWHFNHTRQQWESWDRGPHLFIDDRWIWLFSPMDRYAIHAREGNYTRDRNTGRIKYYSIGIEVVGYYEHKAWPEPIADLVQHAVTTLRQQLGNFELIFKVGPGGISSHRNWGKIHCPGARITEEYYQNVLQPQEAATYRVTAQEANVRQGPGRNFPVAAVMQQGETFECDTITRGEAVTGDTRWMHRADGVGFVHASLLQVVQATYRVTAQEANVRQGPGRNFPVAAVMQQGETFECDTITRGEAVTGDTRWMHRADGVGFVHASLLERAG